MKDREDVVNVIIQQLSLEPHPEGGWFRQTYVSDDTISSASLPRHHGERPYATSIYFLMTSGNFSAFHRIRSDEMWFHHSGDVVNIEIIQRDGVRKSLVIGPAELGYESQALAPAGAWFASHVPDEGGWALVGYSVAPGFDYSDYELADRYRLIQEFPVHADIITSLTRAKS